jgi:hypothetical protein
MALGPVSPTPAQPPATREIGEAQRAVFMAAVARAQAATATAQPQTPPPVQAQAEPDPVRSYRPGRLLDIKV